MLRLSSALVTYQTMDSAKIEPKKKKYVTPRVTHLRLEEAKAFLDQIAPDHQHVKDDLLDLLEQTSA